MAKQIIGNKCLLFGLFLSPRIPHIIASNCQSSTDVHVWSLFYLHLLSLLPGSRWKENVCHGSQRQFNRATKRWMYFLRLSSKFGQHFYPSLLNLMLAISHTIGEPLHYIDSISLPVLNVRGARKEETASLSHHDRTDTHHQIGQTTIKWKTRSLSQRIHVRFYGRIVYLSMQAMMVIVNIIPGYWELVSLNTLPYYLNCK